MKAKAPFGFRYQYLAGGVNTPNPWPTWQWDQAPPGDFVRQYISESTGQGMTPVFTYYEIYQSLPGGGNSEQSAVLANLNNASTMQAYWANLKLFFSVAGESPRPRVVLHVEPDMWGYIQQAASNDNATSIPVKVGSIGVAELNGLPDNVAGMAQGIIRLRDQYAPNVTLGYHVSVWGTNVDIAMSDPTDSEIDALGSRAAAFYASLGANFDVAFGEFSDRDSAYMVIKQGKGPQSWWNSEDFRRHRRFINRFVTVTGKRMVMWQIPYGNTKMLAMNNTNQHYQDNRVEWLLDESAPRQHLTDYVNAGVIAFLWGGGNGEVTDASDAAGDGVTNPAAINGNTMTSFSSDDDGGFFHNRAAAYYTGGALSLPGGSAQPPTATPTATAPTNPTATPTAPTTAPGSYTTSASVSGGTVSPGSTASISAAVTSGSAVNVLVDVEVYSPTWSKVYQTWFDSQAFAAGQQRFYPVSWNVPANAATGTYTVMVGIFHPGDWTPNYAWNDHAGTFSVAAGGAIATATPTLTPTPALPAVSCSPRPPIQIASTPGGGRLSVTVTATGQNNQLLSLQFTRTTNAVVDVAGQTGRSGAFTVNLPGTSATSSFVVRRVGTGSATVAVTVTDRCGGWSTFVGGGPGAF